MVGMDEMSTMARDIRASDAERERTAARIRDAAAEGRLTMVELEERLSSVYAARLRHELKPLVADLPAPPSTAEPGRPVPRRLDSWDRVALAVHAVLVALLMVAVLSRWAATGAVFFWPVFPIFWALVSLAVHARLRLFRPPWGRPRPPA